MTLRGVIARNPFGGVYPERFDELAAGSADELTCACGTGAGRTGSATTQSYVHTHCAVMPPSTAIGSPVTNDAASEHSHTMASAISSGFPIRPTGCIVASASVPTN